MEKQALLNFLQSTPLISSTLAIEIAKIFAAKIIPKGTYFLKEGQISNEYLFMENGFMRAFTYNVSGMDVTTQFYSAGQVILEPSSFFMRTPTRENIQALVDCKGWWIPYDELNTLFHTLPEFREFGRLILVKNLAALKGRMLSSIGETAEQRYQQLIRGNPEIFQYASLKHVASYIGITDTSLSRIRKEFVKKL